MMKQNAMVRRFLAALLCACLVLSQVGTVRTAAAEENVDVDGVIVELSPKAAELTIGGSRQEIRVNVNNTTSEEVKIRVYVTGAIGGNTAGVVYPYRSATTDAYLSTDENDGLPGSYWSMANRMNKYLEFNLTGNQSAGFSFWIGAIADYKHSSGACSASISYAVYQGQTIKNITQTHTTDAVTLLTGNSYLRGKDLNETIKNYEEAYLLGVAADFCVFLKKNFNVTESDAEGRVAVGGDFIIDTPDWTDDGVDDTRKYTVGAGDFVTHVPLDELLIDRLGTATIILGGELKSVVGSNHYGRLNDTYYEYVADKKEYAKFEGDRGTDGVYDENGQLLMTPERYSPKKLVLNHQDIPRWVYGYGEYQGWNMSLPDPLDEKGDEYTGKKWKYPVVDRSQAYTYPLLKFDSQFDFLNNISEKLVNQAELSQVSTDTKIEFEEGYLPDYMKDWPAAITNGYKKGRLRLSYEGHETVQDCVYFTLNEEEFELFQKAQFISFENIPKLPEPRPVIGNDGIVTMWEYAYIVVNVNVKGVSGNEARQGNRLNYDLDNNKKYIFVDTNANYSKITTINHTLNISDYTQLVPDDDPKNALGVKEESVHNNNDEGVTSVLYNFANTTSDETVIALASNFQGTIFAPKAHVTDEFTLMQNPADSDRGHLSGALIAESFTGATEFGYRPFSATAVQIIGTGNLAITKTVEVAGNDPNQEFTFNVTIIGSDGNAIPNGSYPLTVSSAQDQTGTALPNTSDEVVFTKGIAKITLKGGQKATIRDLPLGSTYTVSEASVAGYETSHKVNNTGVIGETATGNIVAGTTQNVETINTYRAGTLSLTKTVVGKGANLNQEFEFTVTVAGASGDYVTTISETGKDPVTGKVTFTNGLATVNIKHGQTVTINGLPNGAAYTVTEASATGYRSNVAEGSSATGKIDANNGKTAAFVNTFLTGDLFVKKTVTGDGADKTKDFGFTVTLGDKTINGGYGQMNFVNGVATFTLKDGETKTATDLPAGITYSVVEENYTDYVLTKEGDDAGQIEADAQKATEFINTKLAKEETDAKGNLAVIKRVEGEGADKTKAFSFTITLGDKTINGAFGDMEFKDGVATFTLKDGEVKAASGLPAGITYTVTEDVEADYVPVKRGDTGLIPENDKATVEFVNRKIEIGGEDKKAGSLIVTKSVTGEGADQSKAFSFSVRLSETLTGSYGEMTFINGVASFTLKHGETKQATGLPAGIAYTVTEDDDTEYISSKTGNTGRVMENGTATAAFVNTYSGASGGAGGSAGEGAKVGSLSVSKSVTGEGADKTKAFRFTVTLSRQLTQKYGEMSFVNGVATFMLKDGETMTATGLPAGVAYTVVEDNVDHYVTTKSGDTGAITADKTAEAIFVNAYVAEETKTGVPKTGDAFPLAMWLSLMLLAMTGLYLARKSKQY